ncbi:hypothetical protein QJ322_000748 [Campylobacter coli]|nr:hypothetical protein [Campylobacter coli]
MNMEDRINLAVDKRDILELNNIISLYEKEGKIIELSNIMQGSKNAILPFDYGNQEEQYGKMIERYFLLLARNLKKENYCSLIEDLISKDFCINGETYWYYHHKAHLLDNLYYDKMQDEADILFSMAAAKARSKDLFHITNGVFSTRSLKYFESMLSVDVKKRNIIEYYGNYIFSKQDSCFLICADSKYFKNYSFAFLNSFRNSINKNSGFNIIPHIHIINPDQECKELILDKYKDEFTFNYSFEYIDLDNINDHSKRAYYTTPRYTLVPDLLELYGVDIIVSEIDAVIGKNLYEFVRFCRNYELALSQGVSSMNFYYHYGRISAILSYFGNNFLSKTFAKLNKKYIDLYFDFSKTSTNWLIDQISLYKIFKFLKSDIYVKNNTIGKINANMLVELAQHFPGGKEAFIKHYKKN